MNSVIFFDTDCLSSFLWTSSEYILIQTFGSNMQVPRQVYNELIKVEILKNKINVLIKEKKITLIDSLFNSPEAKLYYILTTEDRPAIGKGEASAIALAVTTNGILASNNLRDVIPYVKKYKLKHITTSIILKDAFHKKIITLHEGEVIWRNMIVNSRWLPNDSFEEYLEKD